MAKVTLETLVHKETTRQRKRRKRRDELWPDAKDVIWTKRDKGWCPLLPRIIPLVSVLAKHLASKGAGDPSAVYVDLWFRTDNDGFVEVTYPDEFAIACGLFGDRAVRSWEERMRVLEQLELIRIKEVPLRPIAYVLVPHPVKAADRLVGIRRSDIPKRWLETYRARVDQMGSETETTEA